MPPSTNRSVEAVLLGGPRHAEIVKVDASSTPRSIIHSQDGVEVGAYSLMPSIGTHAHPVYLWVGVLGETGKGATLHTGRYRLSDVEVDTAYDESYAARPIERLVGDLLAQGGLIETLSVVGLRETESPGVITIAASAWTPAPWPSPSNDTTKE